MDSEFYKWFASDNFDGRYSRTSAKAGFDAGFQAGAAWQAAQPVQVDDRLIGCLIYDSWNDDREKHENVIAVYEAIRPYLSKQPVSVGEALEKIAKAEAKISSLCSGDEEWIMSIPARPEHDPDLVISSALHSAKAALTAIQKGQSNDG